MRRDGSSVDVEATAGLSYYRGKKVVQVIQRDVTERKRAESRVRREMEYKDFLLLLHEKAPSLSDKELYDYVLEETVRLTDSAIGFFHRVSDDQKTVVLTTWNSEALKNCSASYETHYPLEQAGNWVDCVRFGRPVIYNDFPHAPNRRGLPDGHVPVRRFMSIPVMEGDKVRVILGVGNKAEEYDASDALQIQLVASTLHAIMKGRRAETALQKAHDELELRVQERTAELSQAYGRLEAEMAERTSMEEQLRQSQKMEAIGTLAGGIAHDFNNILFAIIGFTEMVIDDVSDNAPAQRHMGEVLQAGLRGRDLVRQILTFSRRGDQEKHALHLSPLIHETFKLLRSSLPTTIEMKLDLDANRDLAYADPSQVQQIIMNLCTNAYHAMGERGGTLEVSLRAISIDTRELLPEPDMAPGEYLVLSVRDTGRGMDDRVMKRIFEPFFTTKEKGQGTGLGLSVVYGIVKSHNGAIRVSSRPGQGSVLSVYLPAAPAVAEPKSETVSWETLPTGTERILFVDDEESIVELGQGVLCRLGYTVVAKRSGSEALETFRKDGAFDLVITDQTMPEITGVMLAAELLKLKSDLPVILFTGYSESVSRETAQEVGIREFLMKPLSKRELAGAVRRALDTRTRL